MAIWGKKYNSHTGVAGVNICDRPTNSGVYRVAPATKNLRDVARTFIIDV